METHLKIRIGTIPFLFALLLAGSARSQELSAYVQIYQQQWEIDKLEVASAKIVLANSSKNLERFRPLIADGVISQQAFEQEAIKVELAQIEVDRRSAAAAESQSLFEVNKLRIDNGLEVSICPEGE